MSDANQRANRLSAESSPYLRQHQYNPVDWYAWGSEAFEAAQRLRRPIFLSVGYSTCYWCHVMERQCFESPQIAAEMNQRFISIKVDREERPDVDQLYMTAVQLLTRQGGWPMSVFLTPDLRPFYGGTYFPPTDQYGRPGFPTLLAALDNAWQTRPADINATGDQLVGTLRRLAAPMLPDRAMSIDDNFIGALIDRSISDYDPKHGGFGGAPKFPRQTLLELLLAYSAPERKSSPRATKCGQWFSARWTPSTAAAFTIISAADSTAIRPTPNGSCRILRSCCTTTPCSHGVMSKPSGRRAMFDGPAWRGEFSILCCVR